MAVIQIISMVLSIFSWVLLARALISWIPTMFQGNETAMNIHRQVEPILTTLTEPILAPIRKLVPPIGGTMDISIMVAFFGIIIIQTALRTL